ncbi:MAG: hypothetical protein N3F03_00715 [Ignavibacteria bacterium]|nr:hypothetical protein [Ignavibacteria bacterium]
MFDREKQVVINRYSRAIFHNTDKISISDLVKLNIPNSIKKFFEQEIENKVEFEFNEIKKFSKFNFEHELVKPLLDELKVLLKYTKELDLEQFSFLLKVALDLNLDYLLKPCDTLTTFVFKYEEIQSVHIIKERLKFITEYNYFPILLNEYFNRTGTTKIKKTDFVQLLYKIEKEYSKNFTLLDHYNLFSSFKNFLLELNLFINDFPEYEAFIVHLKDKGHIELSQFLEEHKDHFKSFGGSVLSYLQFLTEPLVQETKKEQLIVEHREKTTQDLITNQKIEEKVVETKQDVLSKEETIHEEVMTDLNEEEEQIVNQDSSAVVTDKKEFSEKLTSTISNKRTKEFDRNLDGLMPNRLKKKIIKKIFDENEFAFAEFMNKINRVENWDEASILLTDLFDKKNIQPFSKWAIKFTEFLYENIK